MAKYGNLDFPFWLLKENKILTLTLSLPKRFGRGSFQEAMKVCNRADSSLIAWKRFKYMVFDAPNHSGTYEERYKFLGNIFFLISFSYKIFFFLIWVFCRGQN